MLDWVKRLKAWLRPRQRYLSGLPDWRNLPAVTRLPVNQTGPFLPQFMVPPAVRPVRGPKGMGIIFCWDHLRPLGWHEYQYWQYRTLPHGWAIMAVPNEGAELPGTRWRDDEGYWREEWGNVDDDAAAT